jgi:hypothetical protein
MKKYDHVSHADQYVTHLMTRLSPDFKEWYRHPDRHEVYKEAHREVYGRSDVEYYNHDDNGLSFPLYLLMRATEKRATRFLANNAVTVERWASVCVSQGAMTVAEYEEMMTHVESSKVKYDCVRVDNRYVKDNVKLLANRYGNKLFMNLAEKFGRDVVQSARNVLTVNEFELRFGL